MTSKTMKTILFASVIAAMILPFSAMDMAEAQKDKDSFDAKKVRQVLADKLDKVKKDKFLAKDDKQIEKADRQIERIDIFSKLTDLKEAINNETDEKKIAKLEAKAKKLILKYQNTIQPEEVEIGTANESTLATVSSNSISFGTTQSRPADCSNPNTSFGYVNGNGDSYFNKIVLDYWRSYVATVGTGGGLGGCDYHSGQYVESKLSTISNQCIHYMWPVSGTTNNLTCYTIEWLDVVLVENQAWYAGGEMYNTVYGWTIMVT